MEQGDRGGLGRNLMWVAYLRRTSSLVGELDEVSGSGGWSGHRGGRRRSVILLEAICAFNGCVCASVGNSVRMSPHPGWS